jgi:RND family efflux transporter MFP subunit
MACSPEDAPHGSQSSVDTPRYAFARATAFPQEQDIPLEGRVRAQVARQMFAAARGSLGALAVAPGSVFQAEDLIATLDSEAIRQKITEHRLTLRSQAELLARAKRDLLELEELRASNAVTSMEVGRHRKRMGELESAISSQRSALDDLNEMLAQARLLAPEDGTVTAVHANPGEVIGPSLPLITYAPSGGLLVESELAPGQPAPDPDAGVSITTAPDITFSDLPFTLHNEADGRRLLRVTAHGIPDLIPGNTVVVDIPATQQHKLVHVPVAALHRGGDGDTVVVVHNGLVSHRQVTVVGIDDKGLVIGAGLVDGERVLLRGPPLPDGARLPEGTERQSF